MNTSTARIGYARVSTSDQNPEAQIAALEAAGCTMIRTETGSGTSLENRPELGIILDSIHVPWKSGKTPSRRRHEHRDLFAVCSSRCPYMQLRYV